MKVTRLLDDLIRDVSWAPVPLTRRELAARLEAILHESESLEWQLGALVPILEQGAKIAGEVGQLGQIVPLAQPVLH